MVAYTPEFCLPYFEGTDSPCVDIGQVCAPESVWCSMAAIIDAALTEYADILARTAESFPYAQVAIAPPLTLDSGTVNSASTLVTWSSVLEDSDNMVNLTADPNTVYLRRSGIWQLTAIMESTVDENDTEVTFRILAPGSPTIITTMSYQRRVWVDPVSGLGPPLFTDPIGEATVYDMFFLVDASAGAVPIQGQVEIFNGVGNLVITVNDLRFTARWVADTP